MNDKAEMEGADVPESGTGEKYYLQLTRSAYESSTDYISGSLRKQWERNIANFQSRHPKGSKYYSDAYANRSKIFRPKTRASIRMLEAASVAAFFATQDVVSIQAEDMNDEVAKASADVLMEIINYRLTNTIPWFKIVIGAIQSGGVIGVVPTRIDWEFEEKDGVIIRDQPKVDILPVENLRMDPAADWLDPINSSPYLIEVLPMYAQDVLARMKNAGKEGEDTWKTYSEAEVISAELAEPDSTRSEREGKRQDPKSDQTTEINNFKLIAVYRNIFRLDGEDMVWYTLQDRYMLTDPKPLKEEILTGKRNYVLGCGTIEAHRAVPASMCELGQELQAGANNIFNQRNDNVQLALNSRHYVRKGADVDLRALKTSLPGGLVMVGNIESDVKPIEVKDVTASAYAEQDRLNIDFDEIMGSFSQSSVGTNRQLNETVGGMSMLKQGSNLMTEYFIKTFAETWYEPVIRQLIDFEKEYETDEKIFKIAADRANIPEGAELNNDILSFSYQVSVDVGFGATDPEKQVRKFIFALDSVAKLGPSVMSKIKPNEVVNEVFGKAGYKNGQRFFNGLADAIEQPQGDPEADLKKMELELKKQEGQADYNLGMADLMLKREIEFAKLALQEKIKVPELMERIGLEKAKIFEADKKFKLGVLQEVGRREQTRIQNDELQAKKSGQVEQGI